MQTGWIEEQLTNLSYKVLCADRVTQMTKTYNDIEAVTRLLEEKERDLELAAKIGQTLLEKNKHFEEKNEHLEELVAQANERINQLRHDLCMKEELLRIYSQTYDGADGSSTPGSSTPEDACLPVLQKKVKTLEEENLQLHLETTKLKSATDGLEDREHKLVSDCVQQLEEVHQQLAQFAKELTEKTEECAEQKDEISNLLHQIIALQKRIRTLTAENMDLHKTLEAAHDSQNYLTREIADLKEKNEELLALLEETQEELRKFRSRERPSVVRNGFMSSSLHNSTGESLASELENSLRSEVDYPKGYSPMERRKHTWKVFETAKAVRSACRQSSASASLLGAEAEDSRSVSNRSSMYFSDNESGVSDLHASDMESLHGGNKRLGVPGGNDLQMALRRLSLRRANELNEIDYAKQQKEREHLRERVNSDVMERSDTESTTPGRCPSPDSQVSANSGYLSMTGSGHYYKMPEKLRIVKPLEGSVTLRKWQMLATPHLGAIFESRPGVQIKGEKKIPESEPEVYTLSDYEEDDDLGAIPNRFQESQGVFTFTDSRVAHPSESSREESYAGSDTGSISTVVDDDDIDDDIVTPCTSSTAPRMAICTQTAAMGTSTYSMSLGLASILNERDIKPDEDHSRSSSPLHRPVSSNPSRFPSIVSDRHFVPVGNLTPATTLTLTTNNYRLIPSPSSSTPRSSTGQGDRSYLGQGGRSYLGQGDRSYLGQGHDSGTNIDQQLKSLNSMNSASVSSSSNTSSWVSAIAGHMPGSVQGLGRGLMVVGQPSSSPVVSGETNPPGVINKLKNTGFSLYGFITGVTPSCSDNDKTGGTHNAQISQNSDNLRPNSLSLPQSTSLPNLTLSTSSSSWSTSVAMAASGSGATNNCSSTSSVQEKGKKSQLGSLLSSRTAGGVLGALAKLHRDSSL
ncbi:trafficking kinesin-binding protein 1-like isoform X2 [Dreissena polymorpha]|uniref:trafficking kinesin-binding protein 1-like isoform X2 n=1 Tax=Dreissena polymorpha TaxID=45954 RepID=UPI0022651756|nr:trafficking kinesin-binding protein 1-like isoform X2 [Dreissena polymorpha]